MNRYQTTYRVPSSVIAMPFVAAMFIAVIAAVRCSGPEPCREMMIPIKKGQTTTCPHADHLLEEFADRVRCHCIKKRGLTEEDFEDFVHRLDAGTQEGAQL